jgi:hypothetical protein
MHSQLGHNAEAYIDDVVVKTWEDEGLIFDLAETFNNLRKFKMKLNPEKCTFGVPSGKLLGYMVSNHGIDSDPEKVSAIMKMKPPEGLHDVHMLSGRMATLSRFISWLGVRGLLFFKLLEKIGQVLVDLGGTRDLWTFEEIPDYPAHPNGPEIPWKLVTLHIIYKQRG